LNVAGAEAKLATATDTRVKQTQILVTAREQKTTSELARRLMPYYDAELLLCSFQRLLDPRVDRPATRPRSSGCAYRPRVASRSRSLRRTAQRALWQAGLPPVDSRGRTEFGNFQRYLTGIYDLFVKSGLKGWRKTSVPAETGRRLRRGAQKSCRVRQHRLLPEIMDNLRGFSVKAEPQQLIDRAIVGPCRPATRCRRWRDRRANGLLSVRLSRRLCANRRRCPSRTTS
jgi:hypothetical protein